MKKIRYLLEAFFVYSFIGFISLLPLNVSSWLCGLLARTLGPLTSAHKVARLNLQKVFPEFTDLEISKTLEKMWDNLGRNIGEFPHLKKLGGKNFEKYVKLEEKLDSKLKSAFVISAHFGNWELFNVLNCHKNYGMAAVQRKMNNPYINKLMMRLRLGIGTEVFIEKNSSGVKQIVNILQNGGNVGALMDQRMNNGTRALLFGFDAMTSNLPEKLYRKGLCNIVFMQSIRVAPVQFKVKLYSKKLNDKLSITQQINDEIEKWIKANPEQWFWVHDRWSFYRNQRKG